MTDKKDLVRICCDNFVCLDRGEYPRCYLDIYRFCDKYEETPKQSQKKDEDYN